MKRANRPVPIQVPVEGDTAAAANFKLTDSGVWSEGGLVFSTAGCIIDNGKSSSVDTGSEQGSKLLVLPETRQLDDCILLDQPPGTKTASSIRTVDTREASGDGGSKSRAAATASGTDTQQSTHGTPATASSSSGTGTSSPSSNSSSIVLSDLQEVAVIGSGSSGVVKKVLHRPTQQVYVLKVINLDMGNQQVRRQVTREVRALDGARHPHVVSYHQSFFAEGAVTILMEFMDGGTLWDLLQKIRVVPEPYLAELTRQMLLGLSFLHDTARICHRDVKPSNLLLSSRGQLKISDFGTSSQLSNSMSRCLSWVGTVTYMSPERIRGDSYGFNTDVWSLGLMVLECALGRYPYPPLQHGASDGGAAAAAAAAAAAPKLGFWELLEYIVVEPPPRLPVGQFSAELADFVSQCLQKDAARRPSASQLLLHPFITGASTSKVSLSDLLKLPRQQQHGGSSSSSSGGGARGGGSGVRRSGSYGGARGGAGAGLRQSYGALGGLRSSRTGLGNGSVASSMQHSTQYGSINGMPQGLQPPGAAAGVSVIASLHAGTASGLSSTQQASSSSSTVASPPGSGAAGSASAAVAPAAHSRSPAAAAAGLEPAAGSPGSPQPTMTVSPPAAKSHAGLAGTAAGGSGPVTPAMAAAAAAALRESSPLLSGQLMRQSAMGASLAMSRQAGMAAGGRGAPVMQQQHAQPLRQAASSVSMRQSVQQQHQQSLRQPQVACGPLQQQQQWLTSLAAQQGQQHSAARQQASTTQQQAQPVRQQQQHAQYGGQQQAQQQQHPQGPLAQQLAGMQLLHHHQQQQQLHLQQQQRSKSESPLRSSAAPVRPVSGQAHAGAVGSAGVTAAGGLTIATGHEPRAVSASGRESPQKQLMGGSGSGHGSPVVGQGPLTALKPSTSRRLHEATGL